MNIRDLKYLVAVADHRHFGMAAAACFVSQPALSMQIKKLETDLGVQLIERTSKDALLTEAGKLILNHARDILSHVDSIKAAATQAIDPFAGKLHLGVIPTLAPYVLPYIIPGLSKLFPELKFYLVEEKTPDLLVKLKQGKLDGAILGLPLNHDDLVTVPLFAEEFLLAVHSTHALARRKILKLNELDEEVLLLLEDGHCMRDHALEICYQINAVESDDFRATSLETLRHMVASNVGMTLMPKLACKSNGRVCYIPFSSPKPFRTIGMVWRPSSAKKILLNKIVEKTREFLSKQQGVKIINTRVR